jgi:hypothetical protein
MKIASLSSSSWINFKVFVVIKIEALAANCTNLTSGFMCDLMAQK